MNYQTLSEFISRPFGSEEPMVNSKYDSEMLSMHLQVEGVLILEKSYYIHIKVPSKSQKTVFYDVIIRFFPPNARVEKELNLQNYHLQFFSNSLSFMYKYAVLYKNGGYLIEDLYRKMDPEYLDTLPTKTNAKLELSYDKSIYMACKFLAQHKFKLLTKLGVLVQKKKSQEKFFADVSSFQSVKMGNDLIAMEKRIAKRVSALPEPEIRRRTSMQGNKSNTMKEKITGKTSISRKTPQKSTSGSSSVFHRIGKKKPTKSTTKH